MINTTSKSLPYILFLILLGPALFINLDLLPIRTDEPTRGLVAFEMIQSGNYVVPTIMGEFYYNKPPLYNWLLVGLMKVTGSTSMWVIRLPMIFSLLGFSLTIYHYFKKHFTKELAFLGAAGLIVSGRILFYDSMLGLIDITFSWMTFVSFMVIYKFHKKRNYWGLFFLTYVITAAGFLMKGLPSLVFQGGSLLAFFLWKREFKRLFSLAHIAGIIVFISLVGLYFYFYSQHNSLITYFKTLWTESSQRTPLEKSIWASIWHFIYFPVEFIIQFAPVSILVISCIRKGFWKSLWKNDFIGFCFLMLVVNVFVYWISPDTRARYLFMLVPLLFAVCLYFYQRAQDENTVHVKIIKYLFVTAGLLAVFISLAPIFWGKTADVPHVVIYSLTGFVLLSVVYLFALKNISRFLYFIPALLLAGRVQYNLVAQPEQYLHAKYVNYMQAGQYIAKITEGQPLKIYLWAPINQDLVYDISTRRDEILKHEWLRLDRNVFYIIDHECLLIADFEVYFSFKTQWKDRQLHLVKLKN